MILRFAWRYVRGKKSTQAIQVIAWVSMLAMAVGTASLIIVLSVFNGFESFIMDLYSNFYAPIKISAVVGKSFEHDSQFAHQLKLIKGIDHITYTLEEKVLLSFEQNQVVATIKGIDTDYDSIAQLSTKLIGGNFSLDTATNIPNILLGVGLSNRLGANDETHLPINAYSFKSESMGVLNVAETYNSQLFAVSGVYLLQDEIDNKYAFAPLSVVQNLTSKSNQISSIELDIVAHENAAEIQKKLQVVFPKNKFLVETRFEQNRTLHFILSSERWFVFAFLAFILLIASFNIIGSLSMLVIDKQKDISIMKAMGMQGNEIKKIFLTTGILLSFIGACIGCLLALIICLIQMYFGIVKLGGSGSFLVESYPVKLQVFDFVLVLCTVVIIAAVASLIPAIKAGQRSLNLKSN